MKRWIGLLLGICLLAGCTAAPSQTESMPGAAPQPAVSAPTPQPTLPAVPTPLPTPTAEPVGESGNRYIRGLVAARAAALLQPGMSDYEKAKAAFDWMIAHVAFEKPVGAELWRLVDETPPDYLENRSLSVLRFGLGECEDYAAALTLLLREMGLRAEYVPGLTCSVSGALVDHAWTMVELDGIWYHLDSQLEDNVSRDGTVQYRYFLRGDSTLIASHRWGENLLASGLLPPEQQKALAAAEPLPRCPRDHPATPPQQLVQQPLYERGTAIAEAEAERQAWEAEHGPLPQEEPLLPPPIFGREGFGPPEE